MESFEEGENCPITECKGELWFEPGGCTCYTGNPPCGSCTDKPLTCNECGYDEDELLTLIKQENTMEISENILKVFKASKDAALVAKHFGKDYGDSFKDYLALYGESAAILNEAMRLENIESATS